MPHRYKLTSNSEQLKNTNNPTIARLQGRNWLAVVLPKEESSAVLPDLERKSLYINNEYLLEAQDQVQLLAGLTRDNAKKEYFYRAYSQQLVGDITGTFTGSVQVEAGQSLIGFEGAKSVSYAYMENEEIYVETLSSHIIFSTLDQQGVKLSRELPGYIVARYKLTDAGFQFEYKLASNELLYKLSFGDGDVPVTKQVLQAAVLEEKSNSSKNDKSASKSVEHATALGLEILAKLNGIKSELYSFGEEIKAENMQKVYLDSFKFLKSTWAILTDNTATAKLDLLTVREKQRLAISLVEISNLLISHGILIAVENNVLKQVKDFSNDLLKNLAPYKEKYGEITKIRAYKDLQANLEILEELRSLATNVQVDFTTYIHEPFQGLQQVRANMQRNEVEVKAKAELEGAEKFLASRQKLLDEYRNDKSNLLIAKEAFDNATSDDKDRAQLTFRKAKRALAISQSALVVDFSRWLRTQRNDQVYLNGTFYITEKDAVSLNSRFLNSITELSKHVLLRDIGWLRNSKYKNEGESESDFDPCKGFITDFQRDAYNGSWVFRKTGHIVTASSEKLSHETDKLAKEFLAKLSTKPEVQRLISFLMYQGGLSGDIEVMARAFVTGTHGEFCAFNLDDRKITVEFETDDRFTIKYQLAASLKATLHEFDYPTNEAVAQPLNIEVDLKFDCADINAPQISSSFQVAAVTSKEAMSSYKVAANAVFSKHFSFESLDILAPYSLQIAKIANVESARVDTYKQVLEANSMVTVSVLGWFHSTQKPDAINSSVIKILEQIYNVEYKYQEFEQKELNHYAFQPLITVKPSTESTWKSAAQKMIRLADKELYRRKPPIADSERERFNYLKQVGYNILVEIAAVNLAKGVKRKESVSAISYALNHATETGLPVHPRVEEILKTIPAAIVQVANKKLESLKPDTRAYKRYANATKKGLDIILANALEEYTEFKTEWQKVKANANLTETEIVKFGEAAKQVFIKLRRLNTFLCITKSPISVNYIGLYSEYEELARELAEDQRFNNINVIDRAVSKGAITLTAYIDKIFDYDYKGEPNPIVRFKDQICESIEEGRATLRDVLQGMRNPPPLMIPHAISFNKKQKEELANLIKQLDTPIQSLLNATEQTIQTNFRKLLEPVLPQDRVTGFTRLVHRAKKAGEQHPGTAIRFKILNDRELMAKLNGNDLAALVKNDINATLETLKVGFFDGLFKTSNIKKYSGENLVTLLVNTKDQEVVKAIFDPNRRFFRNHYADKLSADDLARIARQTGVCNEYLQKPKFAKKLLQASENELRELLTKQPKLFKELVDKHGDNALKQIWELDIAKVNAQQYSGITTSPSKKSYNRLSQTVPIHPVVASPQGLGPENIVTHGSNSKYEEKEDKNKTVQDSESSTTAPQPFKTQHTAAAYK